jgi:hypothetical protein
MLEKASPLRKASQNPFHHNLLQLQPITYLYNTSTSVGKIHAEINLIAIAVYILIVFHKSAKGSQRFFAS